MCTIHRLNSALLKYIFVDSLNMSLSLELINDCMSLNEKYESLSNLSLIGSDTLFGLDCMRKLYNFYLSFSNQDNTEIDLFFYDNYLNKNTKIKFFEVPGEYNYELILRSSGKKVYSVRITNFPLTENDDLKDYFAPFGIYHALIGKTLENLLIYSFDVERFSLYRTNTNKSMSDLTKSERWLAYFSDKTTDDELKELAKLDDRIASVLDLEKEFFNDKKYMECYEIFEKEYHSEK